MGTKVPPKSDPFKILIYSDTTASGRATHNGTGGDPMLQWQLGYGYNSRSVQYYKDLDSTGFASLTGLTPGKVVYFWNRLRNKNGWSPWSARTQITLRKVPDAPTRPTITEITRTSFKLTLRANSDGGSPITMYRYYYGTTNPPTLYVDSPSQSYTIKGLAPGLRYYIQAKAANSLGWSAVTGINSVELAAGAYVRYQGVNKRAVPFVRYQGVWRQVEPWVKIAGLWKRTE